MTITAEQAQALKAGITQGPWNFDEDGQILSKTRWWDNGAEHVDFRYANVIGRITDNWDQIPNARAIAAVPDMIDTIIAQAAEIQRLTRERDEAIAQADARVAAAYERAAQELEVAVSDWRSTGNELPARKIEDEIPGIRALTPADAADAFAKMLKRAEQNGQIKAGWVFADTNPEARYIEDQENACPVCGGSGHKDDATAALARRDAQMKAAGMREAAEWVRPQRNDVTATGEEFANAILARAEEIEKEARA